MNALRSTHLPHHSDAEKALAWLDHITSVTDNRVAGRVQLQEPDDQYQSWQEVEKYLLPETPLSLSNGADQVDALSEALNKSLTVKDLLPNGNSRSHPWEMHSSPSKGINGIVPNQAAISPPAHLRPLLNFVVWRAHHEDLAFGSRSAFILLTNDPIIQKQASKFGVRAKLLSQLHNILVRDSDKLPNGLAIDSGSTLVTNGITKFDGQTEDEDDEDEVVFDPLHRPGSSRGSKANANVIDPNHFGRSPQRGIPRGRGRGITEIPRLTSPLPQDATTPMHDPSPPHGLSPPTRGPAPPVRSRRFPNSGFRGHVSSSRGGFGQEGRFFHGPYSRGAPIARSPPTGPAASQRGITSGRYSRNFRGRHVGSPFQRPIDPDSYARPQPAMRRGRGVGHRLWQPT